MDPFDLREWEEFSSFNISPNASTIIDQIVVDSRRIDSPHSLFVALKGGQEDGHQYLRHAAEAGAKYALISNTANIEEIYPDLTLLRVDNPLKALQSIAKCYRKKLPTKIISVTGSFGKTMVKDLLHSFLGTQKAVAASPGSYNSQIGVPLSLLTLGKNHEIGVIEAAISYQDEMDSLADMICPDYTILTPLGKKHLATLKDFPTLVSETWKLVHATNPQGWCLIPKEKDLEIHHSSLFSPYYFWNEPDTQLPHASVLNSPLFSDYQVTFPDQNIVKGPIQAGYAYFLNLLNMTIKAAWLMGISSSNISSVLQNFRAEPTRTEIWKSPQGILITMIPIVPMPNQSIKP